MYARPRPPAGRRGGAPEPEASGDGNSPAELESLAAELRSDLRDVRDTLRRTGRLEWRRFRWRAADAYLRAGVHLCLLAFGLAASISAAVFLARGLRAAFVEWSGRAWAGDLGAGLVTIGLVAGGGLFIRYRLARGCVRETARAEPERRPERSVIP